MFESLSEFFNPNNDYFIELLYVTVNLLVLLVLRTFKSKLVSQPKDKFWGAAIYSSYHPLRMFLFTVLVWHALILINEFWVMKWGLSSIPAVQLLAALHMAWFGFRVVNTLESAFLDTHDTIRLDQTAIIGVAKVCRLLMMVILAIVAFDLLGLDPRGLIAFGSVSGAALAFASKDLVSNWFGGIMLYMDKPFKVGDWVRSPDREIEGTVEYIGWRITKIRTFDMRPLYVPNSMFNNITVENPSRMTHRRIRETIGVRYDDIAQVSAIADDIKAYLKGSALIAQDKTIIVNFNGFGASSLNILVYCMTVTTDWVTFHSHKHTVLLAIADIVEKHGGEFAFPTQTLHLQGNIAEASGAVSQSDQLQTPQSSEKPSS